MSKKKLRPWITTLLIILGLLVIGLIIVAYQFEKWRAPTREAWSQVHVGDDHVAVRELLGPPFREYSRESAPDDYYVSGHARPERSISNRVLIYMGRDLIMYVWIDLNGRVEEKFIGPS